jgi:hypothetical protein
VPIPPELVAILRAHIETVGTAPDGRSFERPGAHDHQNRPAALGREDHC